MSVRLLTVRLLKHGRLLLQNYWKRDIHNNILEQKRTQRKQQRSQPRFTALIGDGQKNVGKQVLNATSSSSGTGQLSVNLSRSPPGLFRFGQHTRKLFIDNVLNRVTTTYSSELRKQATKKLFYGDSAPFFALIGISLASGAGVLTKEDELEGVCWEIREAATRLQNSWNTNEIAQDSLDETLGVDKLSIGPVIAKGCAAVVYAAKLKSTLEPTSNRDRKVLENGTTEDKLDSANMKSDYMTPLHNISRFVHNFGTSVDNLQLFCQTTRTTAIKAFEESLTSAKSEGSGVQSEKEEETNTGNRFTSHLLVETVEADNVKLSNISSLQKEQIEVEDHTNKMESVQQYPFALKMMFNYDIQSNATAILRAMYKETIPARQRFRNNEFDMTWEQHMEQQTLLLPPHPNIVCMYGYFCDEVGNFPDGHKLYPIAQPQRINPQGYGRNMSLYLLMKRYDINLRTYLDKYNERMTIRDKLLLLAQLLEAVAHINRHGIAHRDIKTDNILIEYSDLNMDNGAMTPQLVLSDFGCCLADRHHGLQMPYNHRDIDKGGNAALMAPEILNKQPGPFTVLNYDKSDLWACGAIAYEIFGLPNPFYQINRNGRAGEIKSLNSASYKEEDLPPLSGAECPKLIQHLIYNVLSPNPSKRVSPDIAANVMQLFLWAPSQWLKAGQMPNSPEILQWLLSLTTKVLCEVRSTTLLSTKCNSTQSDIFSAVDVSSAAASSSSLANSLISYQKRGRRTYIEYTLICSFLARARLRRIRGALNWIQSAIEM